MGSSIFRRCVARDRRNDTVFFKGKGQTTLKAFKSIYIFILEIIAYRYTDTHTHTSGIYYSNQQNHSTKSAFVSPFELELFTSSAHAIIFALDLHKILSTNLVRGAAWVCHSLQSFPAEEGFKIRSVTLKRIVKGTIAISSMRVSECNSKLVSRTK